MSGLGIQEALDACKGLFSRFDAGDGLVSLKDVGIIVLALERGFDQDEMRNILSKLACREDGALNLVGLCEVISYAMKGAPQTHDALTLSDPTRTHSITVTLADVAANQLKALYTMHPTFDDQRCWLGADATLASHCVADGEGHGGGRGDAEPDGRARGRRAHRWLALPRRRPTGRVRREQDDGRR